MHQHTLNIHFSECILYCKPEYCNIAYCDPVFIRGVPKAKCLDGKGGGTHAKYCTIARNITTVRKNYNKNNLAFPPPPPPPPSIFCIINSSFL